MFDGDLDDDAFLDLDIDAIVASQGTASQESCSQSEAPPPTIPKMGEAALSVAELSAMKLSELRQYASDRKVATAAVNGALDADNPKAALVALLLQSGGGGGSGGASGGASGPAQSTARAVIGSPLPLAPPSSTARSVMGSTDLTGALFKFFGHDSFREGQARCTHPHAAWRM